MIKKLLVGLLILLMLAGCHGIVPPPPPPPPPTDITYRALLVGITDYYSYGDNYDLYSPALNTERLEALYQNSNYEFETIVRLTDHDATKDNILNGILETFADADEDDISYFYFMGHGSYLALTPTICPTDFKISIPSTYITVHELEETLAQIKGTKVVLLESCFSGAFIEKNLSWEQDAINIFSAAALDYLNQNTYQVLTCTSGNAVGYDTTEGWSFFTRYYIMGCERLKADTNHDNAISLSEMHAWLVENIELQTAQIYPNGSEFIIYE